MAAPTRNQTELDGGLYELVARGVKDLYFIKDDKDAAHPFQWTYDRWPASLPEERWVQPLNQPRFGQRFELEFDLPGDVLMEASLVIDLPTWLPPVLANQNLTSQTYVQNDADQDFYGYVNGIGYFLFAKIEIYQDNLLLQEVSGDSLYAAQLSKSNWNQGFLTQQLAGCHQGGAIGIMKNATPGRLEIPVPMIGCSWPGDRGMTLCGLRTQTFRLRLTLRKLEELVECTNDLPYPAPWGKEFTQLRRDASLLIQSALTLPEIGQPIIQLRTKQLYLLNEARIKLTHETIEVPYIRYFDNVFSCNQLDYSSYDKGGGVPYLTYRLDANYTVERVILYFRNTSDVVRNRLWNFRNDLAPDGQFYNVLSFYIAGQLREGPWGPDVFQRTVNDAKDDRSPGRNLAVFNWGRGWRIEDTPPSLREPTGGVNFTTADRPTLYVGLNDVLPNPVLGYRQVEFFAVCESWALYKIQNRRGGLAYAN